MIVKSHRLTKKKDFEIVFSKGKGVREGLLLARVLLQGGGEGRVGFVVSKKVSTKATVRNKVRRRLRAVVAKKLPRLQPKADVVVVALPGIETKSFNDIQSYVDGLFTKAHLIV